MAEAEGWLAGSGYFRTLSGLLGPAVCKLAEHVDLMSGAVRLVDLGELRVSRRGSELSSSWTNRPLKTAHEEIGPHAGSTDVGVDDAVRAAERVPSTPLAARTKAAGTAIDLPICYGGASLGELQLRWSGTPPRDQIALCQSFARECAHAVKRYAFKDWADHRLGVPLQLVGGSKSMRDLELFIERASQSVLPVVVSGEFGTEKALVAAAIHHAGARREGPLVDVNCSQPIGTPDQWFQKAAGGTLVLSDVDELASELQLPLARQIRPHVGQCLPPFGQCDVRVIATCTKDLAESTRPAKFSRALLVALDYLPIRVPALRHRLDDLDALISAILDGLGYDVDHPSETLIRHCRQYSWPENIQELERTVGRLAVMTDAIDSAAIARHTPWLSDPAVSERTGTTGVDGARRAVSLDVDHWVRCSIDRDLAELRKLHPALNKALLFLNEHFTKSISLGQIADHVHVSPSHLTFLFRSEIGSAFKPFLLNMRIQKAKELLMSQSRTRITDVAFSVGFTDLSHFEKCFRRTVGHSAREYRRIADG